MKFNILIADNEVLNLSPTISSLEELIPNISIKRALNYQDINSEIENVNLLIISPIFNDIECYTCIKKFEEYDFYTIFLTNDAKSNKEINSAFEIGCFDFISKPININKLKLKILHYLDIHNKEIELLKVQIEEIKVSTKNPLSN